MTQNQPASEARHHVLCETDKFRHWLNEPSESSARARRRRRPTHTPGGQQSGSSRVPETHTRRRDQ
jgi:hypothetical protein